MLTPEISKSPIGTESDLRSMSSFSLVEENRWASLRSSLPSEFVCTCGECASSMRTRFSSRRKFTSYKKQRTPHYNSRLSSTNSNTPSEDGTDGRNGSMDRRHVKAGAFIYNQTSSRTFVLLVQSCGRLWGPPKGSSESEESVYDCAIREVKEETGIDLGEIMRNMLVVPCSLVKSRIFLYRVSVPERIDILRPSYAQVVAHSPRESNDATAVGWFSTECIAKNVSTGKFPVNRLLKNALKKFLHVKIADSTTALKP